MKVVSHKDIRRIFMKIFWSVIVLIIGFTLFVVFTASNTCQITKKQRTLFRMGRILINIEYFKQDCPNEPISINILDILTLQKFDKLCWKGPYLKNKDTKDYWGNILIYSSINQKDVVISKGKDGKLNTNDDLRSIDNTSLMKYIKNYKTQ